MKKKGKEKGKEFTTQTEKSALSANAFYRTFLPSFFLSPKPYHPT